MPTQTAVPQLKLNKVTKAQYDSMEKSSTELYLVTDAKLSYKDLDYQPVVAYSASKIGEINWVVSTTYEDYPYQADIYIDGVKETDIPTVNFGMVDATSGIYAPVAEAFDGYIRIYANELPETPTQVTSVVCQRAES